MTDRADDIAGTAMIRDFESILQIVLGAFREVLGKPGLRATDDFLAAGGDSLLAINAIFQISERTGLEIATFEIFFTPTAQGLATALVRSISNES